MNHQDITVLPASATSEVTHCVAYWDLHGARLSLDTLAAAWEAHGLEASLLPKLPTDKNALRRAVDDVQGQFDGEKGSVKITATRHQRLGLFNLVAIRKVGEDDVEVITGLKVFVGEEGELKSIGEDPCGILPILNARYEESKLVLHASLDISGWLVGLVHRLVGVAIRPRGGVYLVLSTHKEKWHKMMAALQEAMPVAEIMEIPAVNDEDTMHALVTALTKEIREFAQKTQQAIDKGSNRKDGLTSKEANLKQAMSKVKTFEDVLGVSLGELRGTLDGLTGSLAKVRAVNFAKAAK